MDNKNIDKQVAEKVMGWTDKPVLLEPIGWAYGPTLPMVDEWCPSESISDAWQVVEKLASRNIFISLMDQLGYDEKIKNWQMWRVEFMDSIAHHLEKPRNEIWFGVTEEKTAPLAICKAALKAMENKLTKYPAS